MKEMTRDDLHDRRLAQYAQVREDRKLRDKSLQLCVTSCQCMAVTLMSRFSALSSTRVLRWTPQLLLARGRTAGIPNQPFAPLPDPLIDRCRYSTGGTLLPT